jgi:STE24 endopeptidase
VLAVAIMAPAITTISNQLSRGVEQRADQFSLGIAPEPRAFIGFQKRIALTNVSDPDPPALVRFLLGTHPSTMQRIGLAERFER